MLQTRDCLCDKIYRVFASVPAPQDNRIAVSTDWDAEHIQRSFAPFLNGAPVPEGTLAANAKSLPALTPEAFAYFLKDFLVYSLAHLDSEVTELLIYRLSSFGPDVPYWSERLDLLSAEQRKVVVECCEWLDAHLSTREDFLRGKLIEAVQLWKSER